MTDENSKTPEDAPVTEETTTPAPEEPSTEVNEKPAEAKPKPTDEEKAAKIAAAKAKAAAKKAEEEDAEPKPPWEDKPVSPERIEAGDDPEVVALAEGVDGSVLAAGRFAGDLTVTIPAAKIVEVCRFLKNERRFCLSRRSHRDRLARARRGSL